MGTYLEKLKTYEERMDIEKEGLTITVSGLSGTGKNVLAKAIGKALDLKVVQTSDVFRELAKEQGISIEEELTHIGQEQDLKVDKKTLELAKKGKVVLVGRMAAWAAGDNADLKIWISVDLEKKAERVANRDKKSIPEAKKDLVRRDNSDTQRYKELYGIDQHDLSVYDMLIDNTDLSWKELTEGTVEKVKHILKERGSIDGD